MHAVRRHLPFARWLALVAVAALVLLPTLGHAFAKGGGAFTEICTPQGMKWVSLDDGETAPAPSVHLEHCVFCTAAVAPPPALCAPPPAAVPGGTAMPPRFLQAPRTAHAWAGAQPRAPPAFVD